MLENKFYSRLTFKFELESAKYSPPPKKKKTFPAIFMGGKEPLLGEGKGAKIPYKYYPKDLILVRFVWFSRQNEPRLSSKKRYEQGKQKH